MSESLVLSRLSRDLPSNVSSDTMTTPTPSMLAAITSCTLRDDVWNEDPSTMNLEAHVAQLTGKEAGIFVSSGTQGNLLSLRTLLKQPPHGLLCDHRAHIIQYEAGGPAALTGAMMKPVTPRNGVHLTLEDIMENAVLDDDVHSCPTRVISLENTLNGTILPLAEIERISAFARGHGILLHLDGARLWEAVAAGAGSLPDICSHFDTVTMCFSKGLGAPVGSIIVGSAATIKHVRWVRKSVGGGLRQPGLLTAAARVGLDETFGVLPDGRGAGLLRASHDMARRVASLWAARGGALAHPVHTNMCWLDLEAAGCSAQRFNALAAEAGLKTAGGRLITHYQVAGNGDEVLRRLEKVFDGVFAGAAREEVPHRRIGQASMYRN
ncbi:l-allo-threonine aldolase [Paramyrothecium foliicola]|nr:l-allo-threonine aldolase [Paramyrothecium foliicola]